MRAYRTGAVRQGRVRYVTAVCLRSKRMGQQQHTQLLYHKLLLPNMHRSCKQLCLRSC
jgi:hypothetical protein